MRRVNENSSIYDINSDMKEAFEAVINSNPNNLTIDNIDIKGSYKVNLIDWTAGVIYINDYGHERCAVYSFNDHKIIVSDLENVDIMTDPICHKLKGNSGTMVALLAEKNYNSNRVFCPVNRNGIMFNGKKWFWMIDRIWSKNVVFVGRDFSDEHSCTIFNLSGDVLFYEKHVNIRLFTYGFIIYHGVHDTLNPTMGNKESWDNITIYDKNINIVQDNVDDIIWENYNIEHNSYSIIIAKSKDLCCVFDHKLRLLYRNIDNIEIVDTIFYLGHIQFKIIIFKNKNKLNILKEDYELMVGDFDDISSWFDSIDFESSGNYGKQSKDIIRISKNGKEKLINAFDLIPFGDRWFDEIVLLDSDKTSFRRVAAVANKDACNLIGIDIGDRKTFGKYILDEFVDDIFEYRNIIFVEIDGDRYALWRLLKQ